MIRLGQVEPVRKRIADATQTLLGDTITLSDTDWLEPSLLPGWSRAQVATHIARSADAMRQVVLGVVSGDLRPLYPSDEERRAALERGATASGLELQIELDTTAGGLDAAFGLVTNWTEPAPPPLGVMPVSALVVARLHEVVLHHLDLNTGYALDRVDAVTASWLLQWAALWLRTKRGLPAVDLVSESGVRESLGDTGEPLLVTGSDAALWGWVTGRTAGESLTGGDGIAWPLLG